MSQLSPGAAQPSLAELVAVLCEGAGAAEESAVRFTLLDHGLQCAAVLAERFPGDVELQVAGLLHDIGHTLLPHEPALHAAVAADFLRPLLGERVAELVRLHVDAKRYLVAVEPGYRSQLSMGSAETLVAQGEAMNDDEVASFIAHPHAKAAIRLRRADEAAKVPGRQVPPLETWLPMLSERCRRHATSSAVGDASMQ